MLLCHKDKSFNGNHPLIFSLSKAAKPEKIFIFPLHSLFVFLLPLLVMSVDVLISPRISFSHDIIESDKDRGAVLPLSSSIDNGFDLDFAFRVDHHGGLVRESSTADELFSGGKLLPVPIDYVLQKPDFDLPQIHTVPPSEQGKKLEKKIIKSLKEYLEDNTDVEEDEVKSESPHPPAARGFWMFGRSSSLNCSSSGRNRARLNIPTKLKLLSRSKSTSGGDPSLPEKPNSPAGGRSFWKFRRSNSLDCDKCGENRGGLIGSLKVILLRSNSTGEVSAKTRFESQGVKQYKIGRSCSLNCDRNNGGLIMGALTPLDRSRSTGSTLNPRQMGKKELRKQNSARTCSGNAKQRRRSFRDTYRNFYRGERVNPALNLPSPYISRATVDLLGFSSLFCNGKNRKRK